MYIELIFLLNYAIDFLILLGVSLVLRRRVKVKKILLTSLVGSLSLMYLYVNFSNTGMILFKIILSIILILLCFGYKDIKYTLTNLLYFYSLCFILGGFLYYLKIEYSFAVNYKILLFASPIIIFLYIKQAFLLKNHFSLKYKVDIYLKDGEVINMVGYMDSANTLLEPYKNRKVIIISDEKLKERLIKERYILVPYRSIEYEGMLRCIIPKCVYIDKIGKREDVVIGLIDKKLNLNGVNCILNYRLMEGL